MTIQIRTAHEKDLPTVIKLINDLSKQAYEYYPYDEKMLQPRIQEDKLKILLAEDNDKILGTTAYYDGYWGEEIDWLIVTEDKSRKKIESRLVNEVEKYVKSGKVFVVADAGSPKINEWIERGYRQEGGLNHMVAKLEGLRAIPAVPEGIALRNLKPEEEKEFIEAVNAGFGTERAKLGDIQRWKSESPPFDEEWIHVAEAEGRIVSVVVAKPDTRFNKFFRAKRGYLGPAATLSEYRGKNLASALTVRAMNFLFEKGMDSVALYTLETNVPSVALLRKIGFEVGHNWKFMRKTL